MSCAHCGKNLDDAKFIVLSFGALLRTSEDEARMAGTDELPARLFLSLGVHDHDLADAEKPNGAFLVEMTDELEIRDNQCEALFCSKKCTKEWFADRVDSLADPISKK